ncbi:guanine nucleotide-binding protein G(s) subunit alpha isoforms XLas-like [Brachypodium distachyon]|uniref:guanine nucleotide-binding protein G(s) subunit alpha isoforms XLas-like n=1 Tax=Brachypodium distachyon TaxID=15368 RepID=UPI000D0D03F1|nr:guanine nucleotide-binding protein G(s) subunit alpha isoforms XLas-like [Brachypodium distachyon]|eukprot:XP_024313479.1 guanine nucleotide-binding protein G(s) subunit alpha isoforms XLas-like [Brachypodium distachyon]
MPAYSRKHRAPPRFAHQGNEDGRSPDKRFAAPRLTIDHEDPDSEDFMPIAHAGPRRTEPDLGEPAAEAPNREKRAVSKKRAAEKDLPQNMKRKKAAARGPKPKPLVVGEALAATQSQTFIASEIPVARSSRAEASKPAAGETETTADPTSPAQDVGPSPDATVVGQSETPVAGVSATEAAAEAAPSSAAFETTTEPPASEMPQELATGPQELQEPRPTPTPPPSPSRPKEDAQAAATQAAKTKGPAAAAGSTAPGSLGSRHSGRQQEVPLRMSSGQSLGSLVQSVMDWNSADHYEVNSSTLQSARQSPLVGAPPAAAPESVSARMYQARVALFETSQATELCMNKRTAAFKGLLGKYKKLAASHKALKAEHKSLTGDNAQVAELLKHVAEVQDEKT